MKNKKSIVLISLLSLFLIGCSSNPDVAPKNLADSTEQHVLSGLNELEKGNKEAALKNFSQAKLLNHKASSAYSSLALVQPNTNELLNEALELIDTNLDEFRYYLAAIRTADEDEVLSSLYTNAKEIKVDYLPYYHDKGSVDYYVGKYYYSKLDFKKASVYFKNVFQEYEHSKFKEQARVLWEKSDAILRAISLGKWSVTTKKIATLDTINRVDAAVVLVNELNLDRLLKGSFKPEKKNVDREMPQDIKSHPNFAELSVASKYGLRGLEPIIQNGNLEFAPNKAVTRADFAFVLEDIIAKLKNDASIKTKYIGSVSPFSDLKSSEAYFNAALHSVSVGFLTPTKYQEFRPNDTLTGVELIQAIAKIKEEMEL
ncbi:hypothetical protein [Sulfurimonas sp.]|uniref:hypothetical protein n=1 Tax=Sulfurimonas sp. TaxID=2022749 RepID=UPI003D0E62FE